MEVFFIVLKMIVFHLYLISSNVGDIPGVVFILSRAPQSVRVVSTASTANIRYIPSFLIPGGSKAMFSKATIYFILTLHICRTAV